jgi:hypothetical protein
MTKDQIKYVRGLLSRAGLTDYKDEIALSFTSGRTEHLTGMTYAETQEIIAYLKGILNMPQDTPVEKQRRKILSLAHEMKWHLPGTRKVDIERVNHWLMTRTAFKKPLNDLLYNELPVVVTAFNNVYVSYLNGI